MKNNSSTKRALLGSVLSIVLCLAMFIGTTAAWFVDSASTSVNMIRAGRLGVALEMQNAEGTWVPVGEEPLTWQKAAGHEGETVLWEPGCTYNLPELRIVNSENLAIKYQIIITGILGDAELNKAIDWTIKVNESEVTLADYEGTLPPATDEDPISADTFTISGTMKTTAGNEYMGKSIDGIAITVVAAQAQYEHDSFNNTYDAGADVELITGVSIEGIEGLNGRIFSSVSEAYEAGNAAIASLGLGQESPTADAFDAVYTDGGIITWTIYGQQTLSTENILAFGRAANRYTNNRSVHEINIVGGNTSAQLTLSSVGLPYAWWSPAEDKLDVNFSNLKLVGNGQISCSRAYGEVNVSFDNCDIIGNIYHYYNGEAKFSVTNCDFSNNGTIGYALFVQGSETETMTIDFSDNTVTGFTRGINIQQKTANVTIKNNIFTSEYNEPDRGVIQLTDAATCTVDGNTVIASAGNAIWFHSAAQNNDVEYIITNNSITAPYLINDDTSFGIQSHITSSNNTLDIQFPGKCMEKGATEASDYTITLN